MTCANELVRQGGRWWGNGSSLPGIRVIACKERPHPGAQLRITDVDGNRITAFVTNTARGQLANLELRHRRRARCEDCIRGAKDTGLTNLPLHDFAQNQLWCQIVALALDLIAWSQLLALPDHPARRWEPKRLRHRLFWLAGRLAHHARTTVLHLAAHHPWAGLALQSITTPRALPAPDNPRPQTSHPVNQENQPGRGPSAHLARQRGTPPRPPPDRAAQLNINKSGRPARDHI